MNSTITYPIVHWLTTKDADEGSQDRNTSYLIGHLGFFLFNVLNVLYLICFEGVAFGRLKQNYLLKFSFVACFVQIFSCVSSILRYNINEEYGIYGEMGSYLGLTAQTAMNFGYLYVLFNRNYRKYLVPAVVFWAVVALVTFLMTSSSWDTINFFYFRKFIALSAVNAFFSILLALVAHSKGDITIEASIASYDQMNKIFGVCLFMQFVCLFAAFRGHPVYQYPATGMTFTISVIINTYVGRMDFMNEGYSAVV